MTFRAVVIIFILTAAGFGVGCANRGDQPWVANSEVVAAHAPFYRKQPNKKGATAPPFIYLQQGTGVSVTGKTKHGHTEISLPNEMSGWVANDLLGPVGSAPAPQRSVAGEVSSPR